MGTGAAGYLISHQVNNSFVLINRLLKSGAEVYWMKKDETADGQDLGEADVPTYYPDRTWNGRTYVVDGTSASAPTFGALIALVNDCKVCRATRARGSVIMACSGCSR